MYPFELVLCVCVLFTFKIDPISLSSTSGELSNYSRIMYSKETPRENEMGPLRSHNAMVKIKNEIKQNK